MTRKTLSIIIVTFNSEKHIHKCITSVINSLSKIDASIIVLDNKSTDHTPAILEALARQYSCIKVIKNQTNLGFAKAVNLGITSAPSSQYYLLLNPDTETSRLTIHNLISCSSRSSAGIIGGRTIGSDGAENGSHFRFPNLYVGLFDFTNLRKIFPNDKWHRYFYYTDDTTLHNGKECLDVDVVTGGFMMITQSTIKKIGLFSESYFMYLEDVDYCFRARAANIKVVHCSSSSIVHIGGGSSQNKDKIRHLSWLKSRKVYFAKHFSILTNIVIQPIFLIDDLYILAGKVLKR